MSEQAKAGSDKVGVSLCPASLSLPMLRRPAGITGCPFIFPRQSEAETPSMRPESLGERGSASGEVGDLGTATQDSSPHNPMAPSLGIGPHVCRGFPPEVADRSFRADLLDPQVFFLWRSLLVGHPLQWVTWGGGVQRGLVLIQGHPTRQGQTSLEPNKSWVGSCLGFLFHP